MYCPKCKSRLSPQDDEYIQAAGVCSYCVTFDSTTDYRFRKKYEEYKKSQLKKRKIKK